MNGRDTTVIFLAGGVGSRMGASIPKQYMPLKGRPVAQYSFEVFCRHPRVQEIVIVCDPAYRSCFVSDFLNIRYALPGVRRQDSLHQGFKAIEGAPKLVCIHDAARPLIDEEMVTRVLDEAEQHGAATLGMKVKYTLKQSDSNGFVKQTLDRSEIWEIQTPQVLKLDLLSTGLKKMLEKHIEVTDDVSLAELVGAPVKLVPGSCSNVKITTSDDLDFAEFLLSRDSKFLCKV